jgi:hypothetical protein
MPSAPSPVEAFTRIPRPSTTPAEFHRFLVASNALATIARPARESLWPPFTITVTTAGCRPTNATARVLRVVRQMSPSAPATPSADNP